MGRVIQFPNQEQRKTLRQQKFIQKRQKIVGKFFNFSTICLSKVGYFLRITAAEILSYLTICFFNIIYRFYKPIVFVLFGMCIVAYFHLGRVFFTENDISIPVFLLMSIVVVSSEAIANQTQIKQPFHYLLRCRRPRNEIDNNNKEYIILEKL